MRSPGDDDRATSRWNNYECDVGSVGTAVEIVRGEIGGDHSFRTEDGEDAPDLPEAPDGADGNSGVEGCAATPAADLLRR
ncbi:MAG TPA: hypothetical protein VL242_25480 [Sorangium sp.]|nr:hypothetical protein [Sorangium sp.]